MTAKQINEKGLKHMKQARRIISFLLTAVMLLCMLPAGAAAVEHAAVTLGKEAAASGMSIKVGTTNNYKYTVVERGGKSGWQLQPERSIQPAIYVNLDEIFAYNISDGESYEIDVEYFDEGKGQFRIQYDGVPDPWRSRRDKTKNKTDRSEVVKITDTGEWKTHTFLIENPRFADGLEGNDFRVTLHEEAMGISLDSVIFGGITVRRADTKATVRAHMSTQAIGNNFFSGENVAVDLKLYNSSDKNETVSVSLKAYDFDNNPEYTESFEAEVPAKGTAEKKLEFTPSRYSIYTLKLELTGEGIYSTSKLEYSYCIQNEKKNPKLGMNNHFYRLMNRNPDMCIPLMSKIGVGVNREGIWWNFYEKKKGEYAMPERADHTNSMLQEYGIDQMLILQPGGNTLYGTGPDKMPVGEELEQAFVNYAKAQATELKGQVNYYELMNEVSAHTENGHDASWYARVARKVYAELKKVDPGIKLVIGVTSGTPLDWIKQVCEEAKGCFDEFSIHPYGMTTGPEESGRYDAVLSVRQTMDAAGAEGIPICISEMGWSTGHVGYLLQSVYNAHIYAMMMEPKLMVKNIIYYDFHDDGYMPEDQENNFGSIRTWDKIDTPYLAKPSLLTLSTVNRFLTDARYVDKEVGDAASFYRFKAADGQDILMAWSRKDSSYVTLSLGTNDAKVYDMFGNELDLYRRDGKYSAALDLRPVYFVGKFSDYRTDAEPVFDLSGTEFNMPYDDTIEIAVTKRIDGNASVEMVLPDDGKVEVVENNGFNGNRAVVKLHAKGQTGKSAVARIVVKGDGGKVFLNEKIVFKYTEVMTVGFKTELFGDGNLSRWVGVFTIKNNNHVNPVKGRAVFNAPSELAEKIGYIDIPEIEPNTEKKIVFNMPEVKYCSSYFIDMDMKLDSGYVQPVSLYADCCVATYADQKPVIDGVMSDGEWSDGKLLRMGEGNEFELFKSYKGNSDLSADVIYKWDEENLYMFAAVTDDIMCQEQTGAGIWSGDSIQIGIDYGGIEDPKQNLFTEIGFALTKEGATIQRYSNEPGATGETKDARLAAVRKGTVTYYEMSMPWRELIRDGVTLKAGDAVRFNMIVNDNDKNERWGWVEYGAGIGEYKDGGLFGYLNLIDNRKQK